MGSILRTRDDQHRPVGTSTIIAVALAFSLLTGCGLKGDLMPAEPDAQSNATQESPPHATHA